MAPRKKIKKNSKTKFIAPINKKKNGIVRKKATTSSFLLYKSIKTAKTIFKAPFLLINLIIYKAIHILKSIVIQLFYMLKKFLILFSNIKDAFFSIIFGLLAGGIGAVVMFSYLDFNSENLSLDHDKRIVENEKLISLLQENLVNNKNILNDYKKTINQLLSSLDKVNDFSTEAEKNITDFNNKIEELFLITNKSNKDFLLAEKEYKTKVLELEKKIEDSSKLMLSSSKSELSNRLYLAKSLVDRLRSGVPYSPQLVALGQQGLDPALLRFSIGGAPTLSDLTARLSVRAGELRDSLKTKSDMSWRNSLKDEISKLVKIKPTNSKDIVGVEGVLLRAEEAISLGNLEKAISEIDSIDLESRGALNAWLLEAKAKRNANIAAENLLAKTTAALRNKN